MGTKATVKKATVKKATVKKATAQVVPSALQQLQEKLDKSTTSIADHWSDVLKEKYGACSVPDWVRKQKSLKDAWKNCDRTDWMMWLLNKVRNEKKQKYGYDHVLDQATRDRLLFEINWMREEFGKRFKSRHDGEPSSINSTHTGHS